MYSLLKTKIVSITASLISGGCVIVLMNMLNQSLYPLPPDATSTNTLALETYLASMPLGAFLLSFTGMLLAGITCGVVATFIDEVNGKRNALLVALLFTLFGIAGMFMVTHPLSLWIINALTYIPWAAAGNRMALSFKKETL